MEGNGGFYFFTYEDFWGNQFVVRTKELLSIRDQQRKWCFEATVASEQPQRSHLTSDLKFIGQTTYATMSSSWSSVSPRSTRLPRALPVPSTLEAKLAPSDSSHKRFPFRRSGWSRSMQKVNYSRFLLGFHQTFFGRIYLAIHYQIFGQKTNILQINQIFSKYLANFSFSKRVHLPYSSFASSIWPKTTLLGEKIFEQKINVWQFNRIFGI